MNRSRAMLRIVAVIPLLLLSGCATALSLSQGSVPCRQDEMTIVEEEAPFGNPISWTAICHEKQYYCSARYGQYSAPEVNCVKADE